MSAPFIAKTVTKAAATNVAKEAVSDKGTEDLKKFSKNVNEGHESGAYAELNSAFDKMKDSGVIMAPFQMLFAQIQAGTIEGQVALMQSLFDLFANPDFQSNLNIVLGGLNDFFGILAKMVNVLEILNSKMTTFLENLQEEYDKRSMSNEEINKQRGASYREQYTGSAGTPSQTPAAGYGSNAVVGGLQPLEDI